MEQQTTITGRLLSVLQRGSLWAFTRGQEALHRQLGYGLLEKEVEDTARLVEKGVPVVDKIQELRASDNPLKARLGELAFQDVEAAFARLEQAKQRDVGATEAPGAEEDVAPSLGASSSNGSRGSAGHSTSRGGTPALPNGSSSGSAPNTGGKPPKKRGRPSNEERRRRAELAALEEEGRNGQ